MGSMGYWDNHTISNQEMDKLEYEAYCLSISSNKYIGVRLIREGKSIILYIIMDEVCSIKNLTYNVCIYKNGNREKICKRGRFAAVKNSNIDNNKSRLLLH